MHPWKQHVLAAVATHQLAFTVTKQGARGAPVTGLQVVAISLVMAAQLHGQPDLDLVNLKGKGRLSQAVETKVDCIGSMTGRNETEPSVTPAVAPGSPWAGIKLGVVADQVP